MSNGRLARPARSFERWLAALLAVVPMACGGQPTGRPPAPTSDAAVRADRPNPDAAVAADGPTADAAVAADRATPDNAVVADGPSPDGPLADPEVAPADAAPGRQQLIEDVIGSIQEAEVRALLQKLQDMSQPDRSTGSTNYLRVTEWIRDMMAADAPRIEVRFDQHNEMRNVELTLPASDPAAPMYIVGGHLDSVRRTPGIDDNGTGSLGTALLARALARHRFKAKLRFLLFDAEEIGLVGSTLYARALRDGRCAPGTCLRYFVNMDMIGHDPDNRKRVQVFTARQPIFDLFVDTQRLHRLGLEVIRGGSEPCNESDDCSFSDLGYDTAYVFETKYYPQRHTPMDTVMVVNFDTYTKTLRLVAAALATAAQIEAGP